MTEPEPKPTPPKPPPPTPPRQRSPTGRWRIARAEHAEMKNAILRGQYIKRDLLTTALTDAGLEVRRAHHQLVHRLPDKLAHREPRDIQEALEDAFRAMEQRIFERTREAPNPTLRRGRGRPRKTA